MFIFQFGLSVSELLRQRLVVESGDLLDDFLRLRLPPHRQEPPGGLRGERVEEEGEENCDRKMRKLPAVSDRVLLGTETTMCIFLQSLTK